MLVPFWLNHLFIGFYMTATEITQRATYFLQQRVGGTENE